MTFRVKLQSPSIHLIIFPAKETSEETTASDSGSFLFAKFIDLEQKCTMSWNVVWLLTFSSDNNF